MAITQIDDVVKNFDFVVEINGVNQFAIQTVTSPDIGRDVVEHGNGRRRVKTAGQEIVGETQMTVIKPLTNDRGLWNWFMAGRYGRAAEYKMDFVLKEMGPDQLRAVRRWSYEGAWISNFNNGEYDRLGTDNLIGTITIQADEVNLL